MLHLSFQLCFHQLCFHQPRLPLSRPWPQACAVPAALAVSTLTIALAACFASPVHAQNPTQSAEVSAASAAPAVQIDVADSLWDDDIPVVDEADDGTDLLDDEETLLAAEDGNRADGDDVETTAENADDEADDINAPLYELASVMVQGQVATDYTPAAPPSVGGPMGLTVKETAQAVSVVTEQRIRDQGLTTATDVMRWVPGVNVGSGVGQESFSANARGFSINNVMIDGQSIGGTGSISNDLSLYESVEVLRGAAGLFAGAGTDGSPAGAVSLTRKKPTHKPQLVMSAGAGTWDNYKASLDASGPLVESGRLRARGIASWIDRKFHYDFAYRKSHTVGLSFDIDLTEDTILSIGGDMEDRKYLSGTNRAAFRNWDWSEPATTHNSRSNLMPWGGAKRAQRSGFIKLDHVFANDWGLKLNYTRMQYTLKTDYTSIESTFDADTKQVYHYLSNSYGNSKNWDEAAGIDFTGDFDLFGRTHKFVLGYNYQSNWSRSVSVPNASGRAADGRWYGYNFDDNRVFVDFDNLDYSQYSPIANNIDESRIRIEKPRRQSGIYTNLRLQLLEPLALTGGVRISRYQRDGRDDTWLNPRRVAPTTVHKQTNIVTPFGALSYDLNDQHTAHISYAEIFRPQEYYGLDGELVDPLMGENWELGLKSDWNEGKVTTSLSVYKLDRIGGTWTAIASPCPAVMEKHGIEAACRVADDHQRTIGVDFELIGQLTPDWDVSIGASWMKTKYLNWTENYGITSTSQGGSYGNNNPKKQLKIWSLYRLPGAASKWRVGVGVQMQDRTWENHNARLFRRLSDYNNNAARVERPASVLRRPGFALWNGMVAYEISKTWQAQLNVDNLTNKRYLHGFNRTYVYLNEPRSFNLTLTGKFD